MKEYIIHGTYKKNLENILKNGYINPNVKEKDLSFLTQPSNQIFTQLLYRDLPNEENNIPHFGSCCFILDKNILRDFPFYGTHTLGFLDKFNNAFSKDEVSKKNLVKGYGNLKKRPNLKKLKNNIESIMNENTFDFISFMNSHEILFNKKIPLKKYCKYILYGSTSSYDIPCNILNLCNKLNISIKSYIIEKPYGLNNFIDLIEK